VIGQVKLTTARRRRATFDLPQRRIQLMDDDVETVETRKRNQTVLAPICAQLCQVFQYK